MKERTETILNGIYTAACTAAFEEDISLYGGLSGIVLFRFAYLKYLANTGNKYNTDTLPVQELAEYAIAPTSDPAFATGRAGISWLFTHLYRNDLLSQEDRDLLCADDAELETAALQLLQRGNYDFIHGAIGIGYYFLYAGGYSEAFFPSFLHLLNGLIVTSTDKAMIPAFSPRENRPSPNVVNLGLSHGISSILKFCLQCCKQQVCPSEAGQLAQNIAGYLVTHMNVDRTHNYFPNKILDGRQTGEFSRLAWCYGDAGIAYTLFRCGLMFDHRQLSELALSILEHTTTRRSEDLTQVKDAGLCHGSAGLAHIYNKLWHATQKTAFREAGDFWIKKTLDLAVATDGGIIYRKFNAGIDRFEDCPSLLEGAAGIGLALLSHLTGDFDWDYCMLLND